MGERLGVPVGGQQQAHERAGGLAVVGVQGLHRDVEVLREAPPGAGDGCRGVDEGAVEVEQHGVELAREDRGSRVERAADAEGGQRAGELLRGRELGVDGDHGHGGRDRRDVHAVRVAGGSARDAA